MLTPTRLSVRAYLSAQDYERNAPALTAFIEEHGQPITATYLEKETGSQLDRPELFRLLTEANAGDVLFCEDVNRLSRLSDTDWRRLRAEVEFKELYIVALDVPATWSYMGGRSPGRPQAVMNKLLFEMLDAIPRKDYDERVRRTRDGVKKAQDLGKYKGRPVDQDLRKRVNACLEKGMTLRGTASVCGCSKSTVQRAKRMMDAAQGEP